MDTGSSHTLTKLFRQRLLGAGIWALSGMALTSVSALLVNALMARLLSPAELGTYFLTFSLISICAVLAEAGLRQEVVRRVAQAVSLDQPRVARAVIKRGLLITGLTSVLVVALLQAGIGRWIALHVFDSAIMASQVAVIELLIIVIVFQNLLVDILRGLRDIRLASTQGQLTRNLLLIAALVIVWSNKLQPTLEMILLLVVAATAMTDLLAGLSIVRKLLPLSSNSSGRNQERSNPARSNREGETGNTTGNPEDRGRYGTRSDQTIDAHADGPRAEDDCEQNTGSSTTESITTRALLVSAFPLLISQLTIYLTNQADLWILGYFRSPQEVALYGAAVRLVVLVAMPLQIVNFVIPPLLAEMHAQQRIADMQRVVRTATTVAAFPALAVLLCYVFLGTPVVSLVYGDFYRPAAVILAILATGMLSNVWTGPCGYALIMTGHARISMSITLLSGAIVLILGSIATHLYGGIGLVIVVAFSTITQNLLLLIYAKKHVGIWTHFAPSLLLLPVRWFRHRYLMPAP